MLLLHHVETSNNWWQIKEMWKFFGHICMGIGQGSAWTVPKMHIADFDS